MIVMCITYGNLQVMLIYTFSRDYIYQLIRTFKSVVW